MGKEGANALVTLCPLGSVKTTYTMLPEPAGNYLGIVKPQTYALNTSIIS